MEGTFLAGPEFITTPVTIFLKILFLLLRSSNYGSVPLCLILCAYSFLNTKRKGKLGPKEFVI